MKIGDKTLDDFFEFLLLSFHFSIIIVFTNSQLASIANLATPFKMQLPMLSQHRQPILNIGSPRTNFNNTMLNSRSMRQHRQHFSPIGPLVLYFLFQQVFEKILAIHLDLENIYVYLCTHIFSMRYSSKFQPWNCTPVF